MQLGRVLATELTSQMLAYVCHPFQNMFSKHVCLLFAELIQQQTTGYMLARKKGDENRHLNHSQYRGAGQVLSWGRLEAEAAGNHRSPRFHGTRLTSRGHRQVSLACKSGQDVYKSSSEAKRSHFRAAVCSSASLGPAGINPALRNSLLLGR